MKKTVNAVTVVGYRSGAGSLHVNHTQNEDTVILRTFTGGRSVREEKNGKALNALVLTIQVY